MRRKPAALQREYDQHIQRGDDHAGEKWQAKEQLQGDRRAQYFGEVAGGDGDFAGDPQQE